MILPRKKEEPMNEIPRRNQLDQMSPAERDIVIAKRSVEAMPADVRLTDAQILLSRAQDKVADFIDNVNTPGPAPAQGFLEVGLNDNDQVVINHPDLKPDGQGVGHILFSPQQAHDLGMLLIKQANQAFINVITKREL